MKTPPLYKTTAIIWSREHPTDELHLELSELAEESETGSAAYCSGQTTVLVNDPEHDPDWDGTEFFDEDDEE